MAVEPRKLLLFAALSGAALVTWVLGRIAEEPAATRVDRGPESQGYYLIDAMMQGTDDEGRVFYNVYAERVEQQTDDEDFVLRQMRVEYAPETDVNWSISAALASADQSLESLQLQQDVRLVYVPDAHQEQTIFETDALRLHAEDFLATTDRRVTMRKGRAEITATGLELDMKTDFFQLGADVTIRTTR